jgi:ABC-type branched-subunit amino acid transport system substrate-binding protein
MEKINKAGGIMGRPVKLIFTDAGGLPAETAKSAVRLMLEDKVDLLIGSHDSADARGQHRDHQGQGALHLFAGVRRRRVLAERVLPRRDAAAAGAAGHRVPRQGAQGQAFYLIGDDYVWPRKSNEQVKKYVAQYGGKVGRARSTCRSMRPTSSRRR